MEQLITLHPLSGRGEQRTCCLAPSSMYTVLDSTQVFSLRLRKSRDFPSGCPQSCLPGGLGASVKAPSHCHPQRACWRAQIRLRLTKGRQSLWPPFSLDCWDVFPLGGSHTASRALSLRHFISDSHLSRLPASSALY